MSKEMIQDITDYKRVILDLMWISNNHSLKFIADLYKSDGLAIKCYHTNVYMRINWNLAIMGGKDTEFSEKTNFLINQSNIQQFRLLIKNIVLLFTSSEYKNLFYKSGENVYVNKNITVPDLAILDRFSEHKLTVFPAVNDNRETGVIFIFDKGEPIFVISHVILNMDYILSTFNPYQMAMELINYATMTSMVNDNVSGDIKPLPKKNLNGYSNSNSFLAKTHAVKRVDDSL